MATVSSNGTGGGLWHDPSSWSGGSVPGVNDKVIIEAGDTIELDGYCECGDGTRVNDGSPWSPESNFQLLLKGTLKASRTVDSELAVKGQIGAQVQNGWESTLDFGTEADPIPAGINFTWHFNKDGFASRGYYHSVSFYCASSTRLGKLYMRSAHHRIRNTYLVKSYPAGVTEIEVNDATGWQVGDKLILAPQWTTVTSNPRNNYEYDEVEITSVSGNTIGITATSYAHGYDDEEDVEAGAVSNITSNVVMTGDGNDRIFPCIYIYRGILDLKDVAGEYMNNIYSYNTSPIKPGSDGYWTGSYSVIESCAFTSDSSNLNYNQETTVYMYAPRQRERRSYMKDVVIANRVKSGRYVQRAVFNYYGGRNSLVEDTNIYSLNSSSNYGFSNYQQPTTYNNCKVFNYMYSYSLHDNVDTDTNSCWSIGSHYNIFTYNGTAIHNDLRVRFVRYLARFNDGWRGKITGNRFNFQPKHVYQPEDDYVYYADIPDGNLIRFVDLQNDPNKQQWYYSYGRKWWELTETRTDPYSIGMSSTSDTYVVPHERTFEASTGDALLVGLYVKNLTSSYIGTLTLSILQGSEVIATEDVDLTALTADEWTLLSISGTATKTMTTTFRIEYKGDGGQIAITDFQQPFTADEKSQAKAVWAELLSENKVSGSFGKEVGSNIGLIPPILGK